MPREYRSPKLNAKIRQVANQYSCVQSLRIWVRFGLVTLGFVFLFSLLLFLFQALGLSRGWLIVSFVLAESVAWWRCVYCPLKRSVTLQQIALYMEEKHPELDNRLVSAMDFRENRNTTCSQWMLEQFFEETESLTRQFSFSELLDTDQIVKLFLASTAIFAIALAVILGCYTFWMPGSSLFFDSYKGITGLIPSFTVEPGSVRLRRGDNQIVMAKNVADGVSASIRYREGDGAWQTKPMEPSLSSQVYYHSFTNLQNSIQYQVLAGTTRSDSYTLSVWLPPHIEAIDLIYHYPPYLGMDVREVPNGGEITALEGTRIEIAVRSNKKLQKAEIILESGERIALQERSDSLWRGELTVTRNDTYSIHIQDLEGESAEYNPQYSIQVQTDEPPEAKLLFPNRDYEVNLLAEVPFEFQVTDDFGITSYGIQYQAAGEETVRVPLYSGGHAIKEATTNWLLALETLDLEENDLIAWTIWAEDAKPDRDDFEILGDPYFLEVRPFRRFFQEAVSNQGGQQQNNSGQQGGERSDAASQKQILIATWNLRRDSNGMSEDEYEEKRAALEEAQRGLVEKFSTGDAAQGPEASIELPRLLLAMNQAVDALREAVWPEPAGPLSQAAVHEQNAYQSILRMRPRESQVRQQQAGQGSSGNQQEWQDFDQLELSRRRNFYEEERQTQQQLEETGEALNKINELAQRQKTVQDDIAQLISEQKKNSQLQAEEEKRRLERLQEEERKNLNRLDELERDLATGDMRNPQIQQALRDLQNVRQQMNRSLEQMDQNQLQRARTSSARALSALNQAGDRLKQDSRGAAAEKMSALQETMRELMEKQRAIRDRLDDVRKKQESPITSLSDTAEDDKKELRTMKNELSGRLVELLEDAGDLAERSRESQPLTARQLGDWLRQTSQKGIKEDIDQEDRIPLIHYGIWDRAVEHEEGILDKMSQASEDLDRVAETLISNDLEGMRLALSELRETLQSMNPESTDGQGNTGTQTQNDQETNSEANGNAPGNSDERSGERNQENSPGERGQGGAPGDSNDNRPMGGGAGDTPNVRQRMDRGYSNWTDSLRNAESLLPGDYPGRRDVTNVRERLSEFRRAYRDNPNPPKYDLFLDRIARPLAEAVKRIERDLENQASQKEFVLTGEGNVPSNYQDDVANYFQALSDHGADRKQNDG